jgi:hypothetical protein
MIELSHDTVLESLEPVECRRLLAASSVGRVGLVIDELAYVLPVSYVIVGDLIVFRTASGSTFDRLSRDRALTFEIDHVDPGFHAGWSVMVIGWGLGLEGLVEAGTLDALPLRPWGIHARPGWIGIRIDDISGRRIVSLPARSAH